MSCWNAMQGCLKEAPIKLPLKRWRSLRIQKRQKERDSWYWHNTTYIMWVHCRFWYLKRRFFWGQDKLTKNTLNKVIKRGRVETSHFMQRNASMTISLDSLKHSGVMNIKREKCLRSRPLAPARQVRPAWGCAQKCCHILMQELLRMAAITCIVG